MSKAKEKALEAYPIDLYNDKYDWRRRAGFEKGYEQAEQDLMDKAKQWFTDNIPSEKLQLLWCEFELFIAKN